MSDDRREEALDEVLDEIDPSRRGFLKRIAVGAAFATPVVSSFSMRGLNLNVAGAQGSNVSPGGLYR